MKRKGRTMAALALGVVLVFMTAWGMLPLLAPALAATSASVQISLNAVSEVAPATDFTATVNISRVENFDACNYDVSFDPAVLRLDSITNGNIGGTVIPVDIWNQISPGRSIIVQNLSGLTGANGTGYLAVLHFYVLGSPGQSSSIILANGVLSSNQAKEIPATWTGVLVQVISLGSTGQGTPPAPASFFIAEVSVTPPEVKPDEPVTISALVTNSGGSEGSYSVILKVNGVKEAEKQVILGAGRIGTVSFTIAKSTASTYTVDVNGKPGEFTVTAPPPPTTPPTEPRPQEVVLPEPPKPGTTGASGEPPPPAVKAVEEKASAPEGTPTLSPSPPPAAKVASIDWPVLWGVIGGVLVIIGLITFFQIRRGSY